MMNEINNRVYKIEELPHIELKYSRIFEECPQKHYHNMICILALKQGSATIVIKNKAINLMRNKLVIINPNEVHYSISQEYSKDYHVLYLDRTWYKNLQKHLFDNRDIIILENEISDAALTQEFLTLYKYLCEKSDIIEKELSLLSFLENIFTKYINKNEVLDLENTSKIAKDFKEYIENNISTKLTLTKISEELGYSPYHIIRICNQDFGLSANAYIVNKRVHRAKKMISEGLDISEVAVEVGFYDQSHLTNVFKKVFALTPKAYQNEITK
jgi:AraC-like DNA-binding protein